MRSASKKKLAQKDDDDKHKHAHRVEILKKSSHSRLLLVSGTGDSRVLAEAILPVLRDTYGMGQAVEVLKPEKNEDVKSMKKGHTYPFVLDRFPDGEIRVDVGRNTLFDIVRGKHVAIIRHLYTPTRIGLRVDDRVVYLEEIARAIRDSRKVNGLDKCVESIVKIIQNNISLNDHIMGARGMLNVMKNADVLQRTLVAPYLPYLRSHSVDKYRKQGFFQFDSLDMMLDDFSRGQVDCIVCIDPHSEKLIEVAQKYNIDINAVNPFKSSEMINPAKLGLSRDKAERVMSTLEPFIEYYRQIKKKYGRIYFISPDDGAEKRVETFLIECKRQVDPSLSWDYLGYRNKTRETMMGQKGDFKLFSIVNEDNIDPDGVYVVIDDMLSSGSTAEDIAKTVKKYGSSRNRVELWCSHPVGPEREKLKKLKYLDSIVVLDTIIQDEPDELRLHYLNCTHHLLAAEIYKAHMRLEAERSRT
jgi:phosphoribosylpyrophosphate synthetase